MEVVAQTAGGNVGPPFHNHDVREWSRIDNLTGVLERARFETDHWAANTINSSHKYGKVKVRRDRTESVSLYKVVDSRARSNVDGALQQRARRQLEVFESSVPGGRLQVIKTHTVSSSRWTSKPSPIADENGITQQFEDLNLSLNPLDLSSQKSKATVGRSVGRRPPSRPRLRDESSIKLPTTSLLANPSESVRPHRVSRLCNQVHEEAAKQTLGKYLSKPLIHERENGDGIEITEIEDAHSLENGHVNLVRTKSTSNEGLHSISSEQSNKSIEDLEDLKQLQTWRRTSKIRRSLQLPKQSSKPTFSKIQDLPQNTGSVKKIREDLETGRRLSTALRGNSVDLEALDHILQSISSPNGFDKNFLDAGDKIDKTENQISIKKQKRDSFVTVESLQEVKGRLRRTSSPTPDIYNHENGEVQKPEDTDDGIVTEDSLHKQISSMALSDNVPRTSPARSYIFGMKKKSVTGTGSLESRSSKQSNGVLNYRNDDWYNRRKSYGFEQVHNQQQPIISKLKNKDVIESSTDSGICRSGEIVQTPNYNRFGAHSDSDSKDERFNLNCDNYGDSVTTRTVGNVKRYTTIFERKKDTTSSPILSSRKFHDLDYLEKTSEEIKNERNGNAIPATNRVSLFQNGFEENRFSDLKMLSNGEIKRHSIAVDESKYVTRSNNMFRPTSLAINDKYVDNQFMRDALEDDSLIQNKRTKKVEFCKTEVHFAAESGRVNIVATDEKPPPTNNFRRRRRNSGIVYDQLLSEANKNGLPVLHFGDSSYEKSLLGVTDPSSDTSNKAYPESDVTNVVTISTNQSYFSQDVEESQKENVENEIPKGILKNKPIKPKPYLLGDDNFFTKRDDESEDQTKPWGVKLKPVPNKEEVPMWKSTVTLKNTLFEKQKSKNFVSSDHGYTDLYEQNGRLSSGEEDVSSSSSSSKHYNKIQIVHPRSKPVKFEEGKGFSTKVNIGIGEATVVNEDLQQTSERNPTWPRGNESFKDAKKNVVLNKALIVRIGRTENGSQTICSKTTGDSDANNPTTTTKITIDLSPSPTAEKKMTPIKPTDSSFKSTSLIMNTFKSEVTNGHFNNEDSYKSLNVPEQLEVLRKLYENWHSDTEADKEVQLLMNTNDETSPKTFENDSSSLSGSWSKMRAFKYMRQQQSGENSSSSVYQNHAQVAKDFSSSIKDEDFTASQGQESPRAFQRPNRFVNYKTAPHSPVVLRKNHQPASKQNKLKTALNNEKLSSPFLVVQNAHLQSELDKPEKLVETRNERFSENTESKFSRLADKPVSRNVQSNKREPRSPTPEKPYHNVYANRKELRQTPPKEVEYVTSRDRYSSQKEHAASPSKSVLRNPKKSEMAYFGVKTSSSSKVVQKVAKPKPQLLSPKEKVADAKFSKTKSFQPESHIYENIGKSKYKNGVKEFDSSVLDELTRAADQILQAVNDYAEESHLQDLENEKYDSPERLDTICETKSWNQIASSNYSKATNEVVLSKSKLKATSSTSSIDSISEAKRLSSAYRVSDSEKYKKKVNSGEVASSRAATKARRLQRASSREALLQSHGSSSEDLPVAIEVPLRKPRLVRKTKSSQNSKSSVESCKSINYYNHKKDKKKTEEGISVGALPEIRHKTAVSTIRSTAEKNLSKERQQKLKSEEKARKEKAKKETSKSTASPKVEKTRSTASKDSVNHRISTASIKKCTRYERSTKS